jgi:hypothetical protein
LNLNFFDQKPPLTEPVQMPFRILILIFVEPKTGKGSPAVSPPPPLQPLSLRVQRGTPGFDFKNLNRSEFILTVLNLVIPPNRLSAISSDPTERSRVHNVMIAQNPTTTLAACFGPSAGVSGVVVPSRNAPVAQQEACL